MKTPSYHYRDSHYKDKIVSRTFLHGKTVFILKRPTRSYLRVFVGKTYCCCSISDRLFLAEACKISKLIGVDLNGSAQQRPLTKYIVDIGISVHNSLLISPSNYTKLSSETIEDPYLRDFSYPYSRDAFY